MTYILLMLLLTAIRVQHVSPFPSCPASCAVCSEDAIICQRLAHIIDAPDSTQALLLTDGSISTVQPASLSDLSNITVIGLSHNHISELNREAFRNLLFLHTLLLDHNLLTSQALQGGALTNLTQLEVLALGHNLISMTESGWFTGTKALRSLKLEGNLLTSLDSGSFPLNDLRDLENLDLSDNLIHHLDTNSFRGLVSLKTLDLSRNRLSSAPAEAFSYLNWLTNLNLDLNSWNCSCQLLELAAFLSTFIQHPDKILYNGRRMVCVSADNPAVTTVLELTEANCVPSNQNITVRIETRGSVTPQLYARDVAVTAVVCFIGGICLTLLAVLIYYKVHQKKKIKESQKLKEEAEESGIVANHQVNHVSGTQPRRDIYFQDHGSQPWNKEGLTIDVRTDGSGVPQFRSRAEDNSGHFRCANCSADGPRPNAMRRMNGGMETEETRERRRMKMMMEEERRRTAPQQGVSISDAPNKFIAQSNMNSFSLPQRDMLPYKPGRDADNHRPDVEAKSRGHETLHCESCHRTYRSPEHHMRPARFHSGPRDAAGFDGFNSQHRLNDRARNSQHHSDMMKNTDLRRETRNVAFDTESLRTKGKASSCDEERKGRDASTHRTKDKTKEKRHKIQSGGRLKVKLNLNPLRKSKVHPKKKSEQGSTEKSSPKKSKEKRRAVKETGEKERKGKKSKHSSDKAKKSERSTEDGVEENEEEDEDRGEQKSKALLKKKHISKGEQEVPETTEGNKTDNIQPENSQPAADGAAAAVVSGQGQTSQDVQYQAAGVALSGAQLSSQHPFSRLSADRNRTTNLSLLASTGSSLSLQGGNLQLNTITSAPSMQLPGHSIAPGLTVSGPNVAPSGIPDSFSRQAAIGATSFPSLLSSSAYANPLQAAVVQAMPPQAFQTVGLNPAANTVVNTQPIQSHSQSPFPPDGSPVVAKLKPDPGQGSGLSIGEGVHQLSGESKPTKDGLADQGQDNMSEVTPLNLEPVATVENLSNNNSQTETGNIPGVSMVNMSAEVSAVVGSRDSVQAAGVSASGAAADVSSQGGSSAGAALLQQEYLSEEGGSSPRRKLRLVLPEKTSGRAPTALERKIR